MVADSFEGLQADPDITDQIRVGRSYARQNAEFCSLLETMHGDDWGAVFDADTEAVVAHGENIGAFCHRAIEEMKVHCLLTGSAEDEMFPRGHYERMFADICSRNNRIQSHIFEHGGHPSMMSNSDAFIRLCDAMFVNDDGE